MFDLPRETHCYLVEPISDNARVQTIMARRFLNILSMIRTSKKVTLRNLLKVIESDVRSVTGHNLRTIMLKSSSPVNHVQNLKPDDVTYKYREVPVGEQFRVDLNTSNWKFLDLLLKNLIRFFCSVPN